MPVVLNVDCRFPEFVLTFPQCVAAKRRWLSALRDATLYEPLEKISKRFSRVISCETKRSIGTRALADRRPTTNKGHAQLDAMRSLRPDELAGVLEVVIEFKERNEWRISEDLIGCSRSHDRQARRECEPSSIDAIPRGT